MSVRKNAGFTLMEILTVVAIVGILTAMAVPGFRTASMNSRISAVSSEMVSVINQARSRAVVNRSAVLILQGAGTSATDVATVTAGDWVGGWRLVRGTEVLLRNIRSREAESSDLRVIVRDTNGVQLNGVGFSQFGRLVNGAGASVNGATVIICAPNTTRERGRTLTVSLMGRVTTTPGEGGLC